MDHEEKKSLKSLINLEFPPSFFNDEIREGFYIPEMMKRFWAAQLKVLSEITKICETHEIPWVADYGSLIGAVRHGGYIPWDDDFDICMLRQDYENFRKYAKTELPEGYLSLDIREVEESDNQLGRIVNWNKVPSDNEILKNYYDCPYGVGVDIFILDGVSEDPEKEGKRLKMAKEIGDAIALIEEGKKDTPECRKLLANIERENHVILHRKENLKRQLNILTVDVYKKFSYEPCEKVAFMPLWVKNHDHLFPIDFYRNTIWAKFETTQIKISALYEKMLRNVYGDYMKIYRAGGVHDYPVYGAQEETLKESFGGRNPGRYTFLDEVLSTVIESENKSASQNGAMGRIDFIAYCNEVVNLIKTVSNQMKVLYSTEDYASLYQVLEECQPIAISLGNEIEKRVKKCENIIGLLEKYCETVYVCHEKLAEGTLTGEELGEISYLVSDIESVLNDVVEKRKKQILFLPCSPKWWESMEDIYIDRVADLQNECTIAPIPCYQKNLDSEIIGIMEDYAHYPEFMNTGYQDLDNKSVVNVESWENIHFDKMYYDEIIIQFPFDGWNRSLTIPPQFCSEELVKHTDILTYSPCLVPVFPEGGDPKLYQSMKTLVEQPTVLYSDKIFLHSEKEMETYFSIVDELTGYKYTHYWENKFSVISSVSDGDESSLSDGDSSEKTVNNFVMWKGTEYREENLKELGMPNNFVQDPAKKILLYHLGISSLLEHKDCAIDRLKETINTIVDNREWLKCIFSPSANVSELEHIDSKLWTEYKSFIEDMQKNENLYLDEKCDALSFIDITDGYYGDGDEVAHRCRYMGIPVMIRKAEIDD